MKKLISTLLVIVLMFSCTLLVTACDKNNTTTEVKTGLVFKVKKDSTVSGGKYAVVEKYTISDSDAEKVADGGYDELMVDLVIPTTYTPETDGATPIPVKEIAAAAFANQVTIKSVTVGANIETIGAGCFSGCTNLESLTLPFIGETADALNAKKTLGYLFGTTEANGLSSVTQSYNASGTATYYIPNALTSVTVTGNALSAYAFNAMSLTSITLKGAVAEIGDGTFKGMTALGQITIPDSVKTIGKDAFNGCTSLYKISFGEASVLTDIGEAAFSGCTQLGSFKNVLTLPKTVSKLGDGAFKACTSLTSIDLSNTALTVIPDDCFYNCTKLASVKLKNGANWGFTSFANCAENINIDNGNV